MARKGENIRKRKDGRWEGRYFKGRDSDGRIIYGSVYGKTYKETKEKREKKIIEQSLKANEKSKDHFTLNVVIDGFLQKIKFTVKNSTSAHYTNITETHIRPCLGDIDINALSSVDIENFTHKKLTDGRLDGKGGLSPKSVKDVLSVLRQILNYGIEKGWLNYEVLNFSLPKTSKTTPEIFDKEETEKIIKNTSECEENYKFGIFLCLYTGLRIGEICALKWEDIDLDNLTISVNKTMVRLYDRNSEVKTHISINKPKTESSRRIIPIPEFLSLKLRQRKEKLKNNNVYVITGTQNYLEPRTYYRKYREFLKECGIKPHSFHCLRHTFATRCIEIGFDPKTLSEILGHSNVRITMDIYVHPSLEMKRNYMELLG